MARERPSESAGCTIDPEALFQYLNSNHGRYLARLLLPVFEVNREDFEDLYYRVLNDVVLDRADIRCLQNVSKVEDLASCSEQQRSLTAYIRVVTVRLISDWRKRRARGANPTSGKDDAVQTRCHDLSNLFGSRSAPTETVPLERQEIRTQVTEILDHFDARDRRLLLYKYMQDLSLDEIATIEGMTKGAVATALFRARDRFRDLWTARNGDCS